MKRHVRKARVLMVDDIPSTMDSLRAALEGQGYDVFTETTGGRALMRAEFIKPDVILLEVVLPDMDGFDVCRRLKSVERTRDIPVIFTTSQAATETNVRSFEAGAVDCIAKPFEIEEVLARIAVHLALLRVREEDKARNIVLQREIAERKRAEEAVRSLNAELERRVEERTVELNQANQQLTNTQLRLERALKFNEALLSAVPTPVFYKDAQGLYLGCNKAFTDIMGFTSGEIAGKTVHDLWPSTYAEVYHRTDLELMQHPERQVYEFKVRDKDGVERDVIFAKDVFRDEHERVAGMVGAFMDITERKRAEEALRAHKDHLEDLVRERTAELTFAKEQAEAASQAKSAFLARMSHELRTPLNAILGYAQILLGQEILTDKQKDQVLTIRRSGEHLLGLINELLDLARIEARKLEVEPTEFHLPALIHEVLSITRIKAEQKNLTLFHELSCAIPGGVRGDALKLRQILLNLLDNAVKYTPHGGITLRVGPVVDRPGRILFEVEDTGMGIPREMLGEIFEPFTHGKSDGGASGGVGLGLSICRRLVELMGGTLTVQSAVGKGSLFSVNLDLEVVDHVEEAKASERRIVGYKGNRRDLLIVDDNPTNLAVLVSILEPLGFEIHTAGSGEEAVGMVAAALPDLVLMDLLLPGIDGLEAVRRIRESERSRAVRVIGITAAVVDRDRSEGFAQVCDAFLPKPVEMAALLERIGGQLRLEWIHAERETGGAETSRRDDGEAVKRPPRMYLEEIARRVERGDYSGLERTLADLLAEDREYAAFCDRIRLYAKVYDDEAISRFVALEEEHE